MMKRFVKNLYKFSTRLGIHLKSAGYMLDNEAMTGGHGWEIYEATTRSSAIRHYEALVGVASRIVDSAGQRGVRRRVDHGHRARGESGHRDWGRWLLRRRPLDRSGE